MSEAADLNAFSLDALYERLVSAAELDRLVATAQAEDVGGAGDITSRVCVPAELHASAVVRARRSGVLAGGRLIGRVARAYDRALRTEVLLGDGQRLEPGADIAVVNGPLRSILAAERVMLNFLTHLSGIATLTARYVEAVAGTSARIYDTRKTIPGMRHLAKYAVRCGGGCCHRIGLHDAVLIKDNHLAAFADLPLEEAIARAVAATRELDPPPAFVEVEVDTLAQLERVLPVEGIDIVLLDNIAPEGLRDAVAMRNRLAGGVQLEASGGVNLESVQAIARAGVDRIAVGALTHSAPALDIALDVEPVDGDRYA